MHGLQAPGWQAPIQHLVVAPRGAVVVGSCWDAGTAGPLPAGVLPVGRRESRSPAVRRALKGASSLRALLSGTKWAGSPVLAAVCVLSVGGAHDCAMEGGGLSSPGAPPAAPVLAAPVSAAPTPVVIGDLWMGHAGRLPAWLASGDGLGAEEQEALSRFLAGHL